MADTEETNVPKNREEIVRQIAKTIHERRRSRGLTLEKVHQAIKIRIPYLQSIEQGDWNELPGEVYIRGFLKRYAQYLGLDPVTLMAPYVALTDANNSDNGHGHPAHPQESHAPEKAAEFSKKHIAWSLGILVGLVVLFKLLSPRQNVSPTTSPAEKKEAPAKPQDNSANKPAEVAAAPAEKHRLEVYSPLPLWLRVQAQDRSFEGFLPQGSTWTWEAVGEFQVRFGHTQQVALYFDSKLVPLVENQKRVILPATGSPASEN